MPDYCKCTAVLEYVSDKQFSSNDMINFKNDQKDKPNLDKIHSKTPLGLNIARYGILILAIIFSLGLISQLILDLSASRSEVFYGLLGHCIGLWIIYFGLKKIKSWSVVLILLYAYLAFLGTILGFFQIQVVDGFDLLEKFFFLCLLFFYAFLIIIFSRSETKRYFKEKGTTIIS